MSYFNYNGMVPNYDFEFLTHIDDCWIMYSNGNVINLNQSSGIAVFIH